MSYLRSALVILGWVAGIALVYVGAMRLRQVDPFAEYRQMFNATEGMYGISMSDVLVSAYDKGRPICQFHVKRIDVPRSERDIWLRECDDGHIYDKGKPVATFQASLVHWDSAQREANVMGPVHITARDLNVRTTAPAGQPTVIWDEQAGTLTLPQPLTGTLGSGTVSASYAIANLPQGRVEVEAVSWAGVVAYQTKNGKKKDRRVVWRAQHAVKTSKPNQITYTSGEFVDPENILVRADKIVHHPDEKTADCEGHCGLHSSRMDLTGAKAVVDLEKKVATVTKDVKVMVLPKPEDIVEAHRPPKPDEKDKEEPLYSKRIGKGYPVTITCDQIVYHYADDDKRSELDGNLKARQELPGGDWREVTADKATMDEKAEKVRLEGNVHMVSNKGDDILADWVVISTKEGDDSWEVENPRGTTNMPEETEKQIPKSGQTKPDTGKKPPDKGKPTGK